MTTLTILITYFAYSSINELSSHSTHTSTLFSVMFIPITLTSIHFTLSSYLLITIFYLSNPQLILSFDLFDLFHSLKSSFLTLLPLNSSLYAQVIS